MAPPAVNSGFGDRVCLVPVFGLHESNWLPAIGYGRSDSAVGRDDTWTGGGHPNTNGNALDGKWVQVYSNGGFLRLCLSTSYHVEIDVSRSLRWHPESASRPEPHDVPRYESGRRRNEGYNDHPRRYESDTSGHCYLSSLAILD